MGTIWHARLWIIVLAKYSAIYNHHVPFAGSITTITSSTIVVDWWEPSQDHGITSAGRDRSPVDGRPSFRLSSSHERFTTISWCACVSSVFFVPFSDCLLWTGEPPPGQPATYATANENDANRQLSRHFITGNNGGNVRHLRLIHSLFSHSAAQYLFLSSPRQIISTAAQASTKR